MSSEEAGRELDAQIAEKVMGLDVRPIRHPTHTAYYVGDPMRDEHVPPYSTDIAAAWQVVEKFKELGWDIGWHTHAKHGTGWFVCDGREYDFYSLSGDACESAPLAICIAALKACTARVT